MLAFSAFAAVFAQESHSPRSLTIQVYGDGVASVEYVLDMDVAYASIEVPLFGVTYKNLLVTNHLGDPLDFVLSGGGIKVYTLGTYRARIVYETEDLTSDVAEIFTFSLFSPINVEIYLSKDANIISVNQFPISVKSVDGKTVLSMPAGELEVVYTIIEPVEKLKIYQPARLTFQLFADGVAHVNYVIEVDITHLTVETTLFGKKFENLIVTNQQGMPLNYSVIGNYLIINTIHANLVNIQFDTTDLAREQAGVWNFTVQAPIKSTVVLPAKAEVVSVNVEPLSLDKVNDKTQLVMPPGKIELVYMQPVEPSPSPSMTQTEAFSIELILIIVATAALAIATAMFLKRKKRQMN